MLRYSRSFFGLQVEFATRIAERLQISVVDSLLTYTTIPRTLPATEAPIAEELLARQQDEALADVVWDIFIRWRPDEMIQGPETLLGSPVFGCFYFEMRDGGVVRQHFINNVGPGESVLGRSAMDQRRVELVSLYRHIRENAPEARAVQGNSWLYNVGAYRRLFPAAYTRELPETAEEEFHYLALWGQFFDREWKVRAEASMELLARASGVVTADDIVGCFPLKVLRPRCEMDEFYRHFDVP